MQNQEIIIYNTDDGKTSVSLMTKDGNVWLNQNHLAELFDTSVPNISMHISNILRDKELDANSVIKDYLTTASDGKNYNVTFYSLDMILAIGFRVRSKRGTQFWLTQKRMAELFGVDVRTINEHLQNIYYSNELQKEATIRKIRIVQPEGKREVSRELDFYNLDAIIAVG